MESHKGRFTPNGLMDYTPDPTKTMQDQVNRLIDNALVEENNKQTPRDYLGGSRLGHHCLRFLYYEFNKQKKDEGKDFPGRIIRRFRLGHWHEIETAEWMNMAGFDLRTEKSDGSQYGWKTAYNESSGVHEIRGHIDGCLVSSPIRSIPTPSLWEHKIMKHSKWNECKRKGVKEANPIYYGQNQTYMAYMGLENAVFQAVNTDTSELLTEVIPFNASEAQEYSDRGVKVITATNELDLPRCSNTPEFFKCKWCEYRKTCWRDKL